MSDGPNTSEYQELDERLREVEKVTASITTTMTTVSQDVSELKAMFQNFMLEATKIAEIGVKVRSIDRLEDKVEDLDRKHDQLTNKFMTVSAEHGICQAGKTRSEDYLRELHEKFARLETGTLTQLATIQSDIGTLKTSHNKVDNVLWKWGGNLGWLLIGGLMYLLVQNGGDAIKFMQSGNPLISGSAISSTLESEATPHDGTN